MTEQPTSQSHRDEFDQNSPGDFNQPNWQVNTVNQTITIGARSELPQAVHFREPSVPNHVRGREKLVPEVASLVQSRRWVGLFGIGGSGKTILAARVAQEVRKLGTQPVIWLHIGEEAQVELILESLALAVGSSIRSIPTMQQRMAHLRSVTAGRQMLIVFDDVSENQLLSQLLDAVGPDNAVLITGRNKGLNAVIKHGITVRMLDSLPPEVAAQVLLDITGCKAVDAPIPDSTWQTLAEAIGGLPLALEIVGADMAVRSSCDPDKYRQRYVVTGKWIQQDESTVLQKALAMTIEQLNPSHQIAFGSLGVFAGRGMTAEAIAAVCDLSDEESVEEFLSALQRRMLLRLESAGSYALHPVIRQFARDRMTERLLSASKGNIPRQRYVTFYYVLLQQYGGYEWNLGHFHRLIPHEAEILNAVDLAFEQWKDSKRETSDIFEKIALKITSQISWYLEWRGYWKLRIQICRRITDEYPDIESISWQYQILIGNLYVDQGWANLRLNQLNRAKDCAKRGEKLLTGSDDLKYAQELSAQALFEEGNLQQAHTRFQMLCDEAHRYSRDWFVFSFRLTDVLEAMAQFEEAEEVLLERLSLVSQAELWQNQIIEDVQARLLVRLARLKQRAGNQEQAREFYEEARSLFVMTGSIVQEHVEALMALAALSPNTAAAQRRSLLEEALTYAHAFGDLEKIEELQQALNNLL